MDARRRRWDSYDLRRWWKWPGFNGVGFGFLVNIRSSLLMSLLVSLTDNTPKGRD